MEQKRLEKIIHYTVVTAILIWVGIIFYLKISFISFDSIQHLGTVVSVITILWLFYFRWGWKWLLFRLLFRQPNLNGTWLGSFQTDWVDDKGQSVPIGEIALVIRQSFLFIHITSFTKKYTAHSYAETLILDSDRGIRRLVYLYSQNRTNPGVEGDRQGTAELAIVGDPPSELLGNFWTNAKSNGFLKVQRISKKRTTSFNEAKKRWPKRRDWKTIK